MDLDLDWIRPVLSGLAGGLVVYLMARAGRRPAPRVDGRKLLHFGLGFRVVAAVLVPVSLFVAYAALQARRSQWAIAACVATLSLLVAAFFAYQAFFVSFAYDEEHIYYRSPFAGTRIIPWSEVVEVGYSGLLRSHFIRTTAVRRIWCSHMLVGYEELGAFLQRKLTPEGGVK
jgi:hypothetical protein